MRPGSPDPIQIALRFVDCINTRDAAALADLMTLDHCFVDATGARHVGRDTMRNGWTEFFETFIDYQIEVEAVLNADGRVAVFGWASATGRAGQDAAWRIPAAWMAKVRGSRVAEWRVYADIEPMLRSVGISRF